MQPCPFCTDPGVTKRCIVQNALARAFPTNIPIVPGHVLIAPVRHVTTFDRLTPKEKNAIFNLKRKLQKALVRAFGAEGFHFVWNEGVAAGQSIPHFHLHVVPRKKGDEGVVKYEPRKFLYRPGSREKTPEAELSKIAKMIRKNIT